MIYISRTCFRKRLASQEASAAGQRETETYKTENINFTPHQTKERRRESRLFSLGLAQGLVSNPGFFGLGLVLF